LELLMFRDPRPGGRVRAVALGTWATVGRNGIVMTVEDPSFSAACTHKFRARKVSGALGVEPDYIHEFTGDGLMLGAMLAVAQNPNDLEEVRSRLNTAMREAFGPGAAQFDAESLKRVEVVS
tara:strand:- start:341 stop:706 length:366 start_codon:yes stop_codon:yes gene_type:complete